jgi:hypothetical protein
MTSWFETSAWVGKQIAQVLGLDPDKPSDKAQISGLIKTWVKNEALKVIERKNEKRETKKLVVVGEWAN